MLARLIRSPQPAPACARHFCGFTPTTSDRPCSYPGLKTGSDGSFRNRTRRGTFEQVLDELRRQLALHYLARRKVSVNETAYLVGFSDPAAFSRAFKRWTGASPRTVRRPG